MSANLFDAGWTNITNTDYSSVVIEAMRAKNASRQGMAWMTMDMMALTFDEKSFDCVIDKAAMDAIMCDEGDVWSPGMENITQADAMCTGVSKVLKDDGIFLQVSFAQPHFRKKYLNGTHARQAGIGRGHYNWEIETKEVAGQTFPHFLYVMRRRCCQL
ncbi:unnamed protein product [Chrysoparadoxa australica]